jgi:hypothetical protein
VKSVSDKSLDRFFVPELRLNGVGEFLRHLKLLSWKEMALVKMYYCFLNLLLSWQVSQLNLQGRELNFSLLVLLNRLTLLFFWVNKYKRKRDRKNNKNKEREGWKKKKEKKKKSLQKKKKSSSFLNKYRLTRLVKVSCTSHKLFGVGLIDFFKDA